jgi:abortive infection bacteriophage resistance protein
LTEYSKPWLSLDEQIDTLMARGVDIGNRADARALLAQVGYYGLTGYLYPFRQSESAVEGGREKARVLADYRTGTSIRYAAELIDFDRRLRLLVLEAVERIEISLRMQIGYTLGARSAFAHQDPTSYTRSFTEEHLDEVTGERTPSKFSSLLARIQLRQASSDEAFVAHFRERYDDRLPIWALTEILELGHLGQMFGGLQNDLGTRIADAYSVPSKKMFGSWISSLNYVRNVAAHHARLFNRKLVVAPSRPNPELVPLLGHLRANSGSKATFGTYNALAIMAYLISVLDPACQWKLTMAAHMRDFPVGELTVADMGAPMGWEDQKLWRR